MGGIYFGLLAVWLMSPDSLCRELEVYDVCQVLMLHRRAWGRGVRAVSRLCVEYPGICLRTEEKSRKILIQGSRKALGWSLPNAIRLVDLTIAGDGLDWTAGPCRPWLSRQATGLTLGQRKYLPSCHTRGFPASGNFESNLSLRAVIYVPGGTSSEAKTLGL